MLSKDGETMSVLKENHSVTKTNVLNEMRANNITLQELRLMTIYLSKINPDDLSTRVVRFSMSDFETIMEIKRVHIKKMREITRSFFKKTIVDVPLDKGGYTQFTLFNYCTVSHDNGEWYFEIDAHDKALPLMFEYKEKYFSYQLWNALRLKSSNQLRMYELLKQYQRIGHRIMTLENLRLWLGISENEYQRYNDFKDKVLEVCKKALVEYTDIAFTYEVYKRGGRGGKIQSLKFVIQENKNHTDPMILEKFIDIQYCQEVVPSNRTEINISENQSPDVSLAFHQQTQHQTMDENFEILWSKVLKKVGKPQALNAFKKAIEEGVSVEEISAGLEAYNVYVKEVSIEKRYVKSGRKWFEERCWGDDYNIPVGVKKPKNSFHDFKQRDYDWAELEKKERAYQNKKYGFNSTELDFDESTSKT